MFLVSEDCRLEKWIWMHTLNDKTFVDTSNLISVYALELHNATSDDFQRHPEAALRSLL